MVVTVRDLSCFDALIWLRTGEKAALRLGLTQASISRAAQRVAQVFGVQLSKPDGEWAVSGNQELLNLQRAVHQRLRWDRGEPLRVEAQYYSGPLFFQSCAEPLVLGEFDFLEVHTPQALLRAGVIDAWLGCHPDVPEADPTLCCLPLTRLPVQLVVSHQHPLLRLGDGLAWSDLEAFPSLALEEGAFPRIEAQLRALGLWSSPVRIQRYDTSRWEGMTADALTIAYATAFSMPLFPEPQVRLPLDPSMEVGDTLVVKRSFAEHPRCRALVEQLQCRARELARQHPELKLMFE